MRGQRCLDELTEPFRAHVLPHLPACTLAALRGTCQAMLFLVDHETGATWLTAASQLLPQGCLDGLHSHADAASMQARLQSQAAAEAEIRAGGATSGRVTMTNRFQTNRSARVIELTWSPCGSWVAVQLFENDTRKAYVVALTRPASPSQPDHEQGAEAFAGIPCSEVKWLGNAHGSLMVSQCATGSRYIIRLFSAASRAMTCSHLTGQSLLSHELSPCRTLLLCQHSPAATPMYSVWSTVTHTGVQLQLPHVESAKCFGWSSRTSWSYDSSLAALFVHWQRVSGGTTDWIGRLLIYAATERLLQAREVGHLRQFNWSPTANILAVVTGSSFKLWTASTNTWASATFILDPHMTSIDWSPGGKHVAVTSANGQIGSLSTHHHLLGCILSAAGTICWTGSSDAGYQARSGLVREHESRWSANGTVFLWTDSNTQPGLMLVTAEGNFKEVGLISSKRSSVSPCGRVVVSARGRFDASQKQDFNVSSQINSLGGMLPHAMDKQLPFKAQYTTPCLTWHPSGRLSMVYAIADANSSVWITDGSSGAVLRMLSWGDLMQTMAGPERVEAQTIRLAWSPDGCKLCVGTGSGLVIISFGK